MCLCPAAQVNARPPAHNAPQPAFEEEEQEMDVEQQEEEVLAPVVSVPDKGVYQNLVHASTLVSVNKLEAYIKERDNITDGFVPEYNVSHCCWCSRALAQG